MLFNSLEFALFLPLVFALYWSMQNKLRWQNALLFGCSYFFYAQWDWRFMFLLLFSTLLDYVTGLKIAGAKNDASRKFWFWLSIGINLGFLGVFKYYNFFSQSLAEGLSRIGFSVNPFLIQVILPVGISFYTFHGLSYVIDVYKKRISAEQNFIDYAVFVSFFPLLVAGPIERATHLLPQIKTGRSFSFEKAVDGLRQILWGLFKKMVIADNCARFANEIFAGSEAYSGSTLLLGALFFTFQIYGDFSGYSDIALGSARLFGIELLRNFAFPYFSRDIAEFWRRWHISLSSWFKDYLYIPLGGSSGGTGMRIRNTFAIFLVSGFWHGANWTFIAWGFLNALYFLPLLLSGKNRSNMEIVAKGRILPGWKDAASMAGTFFLTVIAWIFFRADHLSHAFQILGEIFSPSLLSLPAFEGMGNSLTSMIFLALFLVVEWLGRENQFAIQQLSLLNRPLRYLFYYALIFILFWFGGEEQQFIYFQF